MKIVAMVSIVLGVVGATSAEYTYTYGPGTNFGSKSLNAQESMLVVGGGGTRLTLYDWTSATVESTSSLGYMTGGIWETYMYAYSSATIAGGELNVVYVEDHSYLTLSGGNVYAAVVEGYGHLTMSGGTLTGLYGQLPLIHGTEHNGPPTIIQKNIEVICKSWDYNATTKRLTGVWGDDSAFNIHLVDTADYPATFDSINFTIVPEPMTLGLLALGGLAVRRCRRSVPKGR